MSSNRRWVAKFEKHGGSVAIKHFTLYFSILKMAKKHIGRLDNFAFTALKLIGALESQLESRLQSDIHLKQILKNRNNVPPSKTTGCSRRSMTYRK